MTKNKSWIFILFGFSTIPFYILWYRSETICIQNPNKTYTHIIGAGTTGCVLAARLSENTNNKILLVEAGGHFGTFSKIPIFATFLQKSKYDWSYETEVQKWSSEGFFEKKQSLPRGKGLGGTGQMNFMITDVNHQSIKNSLKMWDSMDASDIKKSIIEFFKRLKNSGLSSYNLVCNYQKYLFRKAKPNKSICKLKTKSNYPLYLQKKESHVGYIFQKAVMDLQENELKYQPCISSIYQGQRWSTYDSHLKQAFTRDNLHVLCHTEVRKIIFKNKHAIGIYAVDQHDKKYTIYVKSEIILCAGTINTPKLLLLSGVGNSTELQQLNIPVTVDIPGVGLNMHDHFNIPLYVSIEEPISLTTDKILNLRELYSYVFYKEGVLAALPIVGIAQIPSNVSLILFAMGSTDEKIFCKIANYSPVTFRGVFPHCDNHSQEGLVFLASCAEPKSRGFIKLKSKKALDPIIIDPQYLHDEYDVLCIKYAIKLVTAIINTQAFKNIGATIHWPQLETCKHYAVNFQNDKYLECIIRTAGITSYHQAGTCKMGNDDDVYSVVDEIFRVKGTTGLRVIDASILPTPASTFPNIILIAIAEYAVKIL